MHGLRDPNRTLAFLSSFGPIRQHFSLKRHLLRVSLYRKQLGERFAAWHRFTELSQNPSGFGGKISLSNGLNHGSTIFVDSGFASNVAPTFTNHFSNSVARKSAGISSGVPTSLFELAS
jgi:hypothetical protein